MATNSKHRKDHKKKLEARKNRLAQEKAQAQKYQKEFIMNLIKQEQEKGLFENTPNANAIAIGGQNGPIIEGPAI